MSKQPGLPPYDPLLGVRSFSYEVIDRPGQQREYRIRDDHDNRVATCFVEENAEMLVTLLNIALRFIGPR